MTWVSGSIAPQPGKCRGVAVAIASRKGLLPQVMAYWLRSSLTAAAAAVLSSGGQGKSGKPWARLTAPAATASRFISRMTDSVNRSALAEMRGRTMRGSLARARRQRSVACDDAGMQDETPVAIGPWTRRSRRVAYENPWVTVWHDEVIRPDGQPGIYGVVHFANLAAGILALDEDDRVLLVGQHRYSLDEYSWEIPEGGVPDGESALDGARRELIEETGVTAADWGEIARAHLSNSVSDELAVIYLATDLTIGEASPDGTEDLALRWLPFEEVLDMTLRGEITDAMTIIAVERLALTRRLGR